MLLVHCIISIPRIRFHSKHWKEMSKELLPNKPVTVKLCKAKLAMLYQHVPDLQDMGSIMFEQSCRQKHHLAKIPEEVFYVFNSTVGGQITQKHSRHLWTNLDSAEACWVDKGKDNKGKGPATLVASLRQSIDVLLKRQFLGGATPHSVSLSPKPVGPLCEN